MLLGRTSITDVEMDNRLLADKRVTFVSLDIADDRAVRALVDGIDPALPLRGVIHTAGCTDDASLLNQDWERFVRVAHAKVRGAWALHRATSEAPLDFFTCYTSASALFGVAGQANYAAANAYVDALIAQRRALGRPGQSIAFGPWNAGLAAGLSSRQRQLLAQQGVHLIDQASGKAAIATLLGSNETYVVVLGKEDAQNEPQIDSEPHKLPPVTTEPIPIEEEDIDWTSHSMVQITEPASSDFKSDFLEFSRAKLVELLGLLPHQIPEDTLPLALWGVDSITLIDLNRAMEKKFGVYVAETQLLDSGPDLTLLDVVRQYGDCKTRGSK